MNRKKLIGKLVLLCFIFLSIVSCKFFNSSVKEYLDYWSNSVVVGKFEPISNNVHLNGNYYLDASDQIKIYMYVSNPQEFNLRFANDSVNPTIGLYYEDNGNEKPIEANLEYELFDNNKIVCITANLSETTEKEKIKLKGYYGIQKESNVVSETVYFEWDFFQNTPPDSPEGIKNPTNAEKDGFHCLHFNYPNKYFKRNTNLKYEIECYFKNEFGQYEFVDKKILTKEDTKDSSNTREFIYYFDLQDKNYQYDYKVTFINQEGIKSETISTAQSLGVCKVTEPEIKFPNGTLLNYEYDEQEQCEYEIYDYSFLENDNLNYYIANIDEDIGTENAAKMITYIDNVKYTEDVIEGYFTTEGVHTIKVELTKNMCKPVVVEKKIKVSIKPITVKFKGFKMYTDMKEGTSDNNENDLYGIYKLQGEVLWNKIKIGLKRYETSSLKCTDKERVFTAYDKETSYSIAFENWYEEDGGLDGDDDVGSWYGSIKIQDMKNYPDDADGKYFKTGWSGENNAYWKVYFTLSD